MEEAGGGGVSERGVVGTWFLTVHLATRIGFRKQHLLIR